jgi:hypothetical protein
LGEAQSAVKLRGQVIVLLTTEAIRLGRKSRFSRFMDCFIWLDMTMKQIRVRWRDASRNFAPNCAYRMVLSNEQ